mgnify:CR=1 FL=1
MEILRTILTVIYVIDCIALTVVVLMQEGKQQGGQGRGGHGGRHGQEQAPVRAQAQAQVPGPGGRYEACHMTAAVRQNEQDGAFVIEKLDGRRSEEGLHAASLPQLLRGCKHDIVKNI